MKCFDDCHYYEMDMVMPDRDRDKAYLRFYEMRENGDRINGVTNEEVLEVLIHRIKVLNGKHPCRENSIAITKLEECRMWLNKRTEDRLERKVEGTHQP